MVAEDGSRNNSNKKTSVTMSTNGAESAHVENKTKQHDDNGCQTMEIENVRKEKTIKKGLMNNARRALLVGVTEEQKKPGGGKKRPGCTRGCLQVYNGSSS